MTSEAYRLFAQAMAEQKPIHCRYQGRVREICPVILGHSKGEEAALVFQFGGESSQRLPPGGAWKCLHLSKVSEVLPGEGPWRTGSNHDRPQSCVEVVDLDINPNSPYSPKRRLGRS